MKFNRIILAILIALTSFSAIAQQCKTVEHHQARISWDRQKGKSIEQTELKSQKVIRKSIHKNLWARP